MTGYHAAMEPHEQQDKLRAHFVCFLCIRKIKGLRAEQILESGSNVLENNDFLCDVLLLQASHLPTAAQHCIIIHLGLGQNYAGREKMAKKKTKKERNDNNPKKPREQKFLALLF